MSKRITHAACLECGADSGEASDPWAWSVSHGCGIRAMYQYTLVDDGERAE